MGFRQYYTLRHHYRIIMWDLVTRDYSKRMRPEQVLNNVKRYVRNGSIITFHDSLKSWNNGNLQYALPRAIEFLKRKAMCSRYSTAGKETFYLPTASFLITDKVFIHIHYEKAPLLRPN